MFEINLKDERVSLNKSERGKIYDRNGQLLSTNIKSHSLFANALMIENKFELSKKISSIINIDSEVIYEKLSSNKKFIYNGFSL